MTARKTVRIFISSPSDVSEERDNARKEIKELGRFYPEATLQAVLWEDMAIPATTSFQAGIEAILAREPIDIAVFILWSRLGSPLASEITRPDGTPYRSGTEREFDLMLTIFAQSGNKRPVILAYAREDGGDVDFRKKIGKESLDSWDQMLAQKKLVSAFVREQFVDNEGRNLRAYLSYPGPASFAEKLRTHLIPVLNELLAVDSVPTWTEAPYRGLEFFDVGHAQIFHGRERESYDVLNRLRDQRKAGCAFVVIVGASGSGKSSLARAGVAATLKERPYVDDAKQLRIASLLPSLAGSDPYTSLARVICEQLPGPATSDEAVDYLAEGFVRDPETAIRLGIVPAFQHAEEQAQGAVRLLLIVDQLEELWTDRPTVENRARFLTALEALARCGYVAVLATLRSDFYERACLEPVFVRMKGEKGAYDLLAPETPSLRRIIREPARASGLEFDSDEREGRLEEVIERDASKDPSALPQLQYALDELYRAAEGERRKLTFTAYRAMGGVEGAIGERARQMFERLPKESQAALEEILPLLVSVDENDVATGRRSPREEFFATPARRTVTEALIAGRFLKPDRSERGPVIGPAHESLLRKWDTVVRWIEINKTYLQMRRHVEQQEALSKPLGALIPDGIVLEEGRKLLAEREELLSPATADYVRKSSAHADEVRLRETKRLQQTATKFRRLALIAAAAGTVAVVAGVVAYRRQQAADEQRSLAESNASDAERQRNIAVENERQAKAQSARSNYFAAEALWNDRRGDEAIELLESIPEEHRHFEWRLAFRRYQGSDVTLYARVEGSTAIAVSPDGSRLFTGDGDGTIHVRDAGSGTELNRLKRHPDSINCLTCSPDGKLLASASKNLAVCLWDTSKWSEPKLLKDHAEDVHALAFSPDGKLLISAGNEKVVFWDVAKGTEVRSISRGKLPEQAGEFNSLFAVNRARGVALGPDGSLLAMVNAEGETGLWDPKNGKVLRTFRKNSLLGNGLDFPALSPDGMHLAVGTGSTIVIRNVHTGRRVRTLTSYPFNVQSLAYSPDGSQLACGGGYMTAGYLRHSIDVWDIATGKKSETFTGHSGWISSLAFTPDGSRLISASGDGVVKIWNVQHTMQFFSRSGVSDVAFSSDSPRSAVAMNDGTLKLLDSATGSELKTFSGHKGSVLGVAVSANGLLLASASSDGTVKLWSAETGEEIHSLIGHQGIVRFVTFSLDGSRVASCGDDNTIRIWDSRSGNLTATIGFGSMQAFRVAFHPDGTQLAGSNGETITIWNVTTGAAIRTLPGRLNLGGGVAFSPDGSRLASGDYSGMVRIWDLTTGNFTRLPGGHAERVFDVAFSRDGLRLASSSFDGSVKIWDAQAGTELVSLAGERYGMGNISFSADGTMLAAAGNGRLMLWNGRIRREFRILQGHTDYVSDVAIHPTGDLLASTSHDGTIKLWNTETGVTTRTIQDAHAAFGKIDFFGDGKQLFVVDTQNKRTGWDCLAGQGLDAQASMDLQPRLLRQSTDKLRAIPNRRVIKLVDLTFQNDPVERAFREILATASPEWHWEQAGIAERTGLLLPHVDKTEVPPDWYAALFHLAWVRKARPEDIDVQKRMRTAYDNYRKEFATRLADSAKADEAKKEPLPVSKDPDDYLAPIVREMLASLTPEK